MNSKKPSHDTVPLKALWQSPDLDTHEEGDGHGDQEEDEGEAGEDECADSRVLVVYKQRRLTRETENSLQTKPNTGCWRYRIYVWN
jgi:hypothetical protein